MRGWLLWLLFTFCVQALPARAAEPEAVERAHKHYVSGVSLFESGNKEQALVEFELANELVPKKENLFMIAQCQYHLGQLVEARTQYQAYLNEQSQGELADLARLRLEAINRRPGTFAINTVPDQVDVRIEGESNVITGQAPNEFRVPRGHYRVTASKPNFGSETRELSIEVAETKPLFFKLDPIPAHLELHTLPTNATLYVRGNRTQNPYIQDVAPGNYEIYAEAPYYQPKRETISLSPGELRTVHFPLTYVQRSGRPELIGFWTGIGAAGGGLFILTRGDPSQPTKSLYAPLFVTGMAVGGIGAAVLSTTLAPRYIRDNLALFRIGSMWIGDLEGATLAMGLSHDWTTSWIGGLVGLTGGAFAGWWLDDKAPNYGRVAMIQSAALMGVTAGAVSVSALGLYPSNQDTEPRRSNLMKRRLSWGMLAGLDVGLGAGLAMAYLPDQRPYGPTWQRVILVDLAVVAGAVLAGVVEFCTAQNFCANNSDLTLTRRTARFALGGAGLGLLAGWLLTMNYDRPSEVGPERPALSFLPTPGVVPVESMTGTTELVPGLLSQGRF